MPESSNQPDHFDRLLSEMPRISEAVNAFTSEKAQRIALRALVHAAGLAENSGAAPAALSVVTPIVTEQVPQADDMNGPAEPDAGAGTAAKPNGRTKTTRKPSNKKNYPRVKDINFRPDGKPTLREFYAEKAPASFLEKNLTFVYYFEKYMEVEEITVAHVLAAYDEIPEKSPADPENSLTVTAHRKRWLDTANLKAIRTTHSGRNMVEYDMPVMKKDSKSA